MIGSGQGGSFCSEKFARQFLPQTTYIFYNIQLHILENLLKFFKSFCSLRTNAAEMKKISHKVRNNLACTAQAGPKCSMCHVVSVQKIMDQLLTAER